MVIPKNNYEQDADSESSGSKPTVPVVVPASGAQPMLDGGAGDPPAGSVPMDLSVDATDVAEQG